MGFKKNDLRISKRVSYRVSKTCFQKMGSKVSESKPRLRRRRRSKDEKISKEGWWIVQMIVRPIDAIRCENAKVSRRVGVTHDVSSLAFYAPGNARFDRGKTVGRKTRRFRRRAGGSCR